MLQTLIGGIHGKTMDVDYDSVCEDEKHQLILSEANSRKEIQSDAATITVYLR